MSSRYPEPALGRTVIFVIGSQDNLQNTLISDVFILKDTHFHVTKIYYLSLDN